MKILLSAHTRSEKISKYNNNIYFEIEQVKNWTKTYISKFDLVIPISEKQIEYIHKNNLVTSNMAIINYDKYKLLKNKVMLNTFLQKNGFKDNIPKMENIDGKIVIKPIKGMSSNGVTFHNKIGNKKIKNDFFVQEYKRGNEEYSTDIVIVNNKIIQNTNKFKTEEFSVKNINKKEVSVEVDEHILKTIENMYKKLKLNSLVNFDYTIVDNNLFLYEINPRSGSSHWKKIIKTLIKKEKIQNATQKTSI